MAQIQESEMSPGLFSASWFSLLVLLKESGDSPGFYPVVFWCKPGVLGGRVSPRFPFVTPVVQSLSSDLLQAISHWAKSHLENC